MKTDLVYVDKIRNVSIDGLASKPRFVKQRREWDVTCYCGSTMVLVLWPKEEACPPCEINNCPGCKYYNKGKKKFYVCTRDRCDGIHSACRDGKPMGIPGSPKCHLLRHYAHIELDSLHQSKFCDRGKSYAILRDLMKKSSKDCHIGKFGIRDCKRTIVELRKFKRKNGLSLTLPKK